MRKSDLDGLSGINNSNDTLQLPALFWDDLTEEKKAHPDYEALNAIIYDETTLYEQADNFKDQGNQKLKVAQKSKNKQYYKEALTYYDKAINLKCGDNKLESIIYSNKSQTQIYLENWRNALNDAKKAIILDNRNIKAYYRASVSAMKLKDYKMSIEMCQNGIKIEPSNNLLKKLLKESEIEQEKIGEKEEKLRKLEEEQIRKATILADEFLKRNIRICQSAMKISGYEPYIDEFGDLCWPILFVYPETMMRDIFPDVSEYVTLATCLDKMYGSDIKPLVWDEKNEYKRDKLEIYALANAGKQFNKNDVVLALCGKYNDDDEKNKIMEYGDKAAYFFKINENLTLNEIMKDEKFMVAGVPTFFVVAKESDFYDKFLESNII